MTAPNENQHAFALIYTLDFCILQNIGTGGGRGGGVGGDWAGVFVGMGGVLMRDCLGRGD